jgi:hypothetical protein
MGTPHSSPAIPAKNWPAVGGQVFVCAGCHPARRRRWLRSSAWTSFCRRGRRASEAKWLVPGWDGGGRRPRYGLHLRCSSRPGDSCGDGRLPREIEPQNAEQSEGRGMRRSIASLAASRFLSRRASCASASDPFRRPGRRPRPSVPAPGGRDSEGRWFDRRLLCQGVLPDGICLSLIAWLPVGCPGRGFDATPVG